MSSPAGRTYWAVVALHWSSFPLYDERAFARAYGKLDEVTRNLLTAHWYTSEVRNGGHRQFFENSTGILAPEARAGLSAVGMTGLADVLARAIAMVGEDYPRSRKTRLAAIRGLGGNAVGAFRALDDEFFALLRTEGGGWDEAADRYASSAGQQSAGRS